MSLPQETEITEKDREVLRAVYSAVRKLNEIVEEQHDSPYEVELHITKHKQGYPVVRHELHRKIG